MHPLIDILTQANLEPICTVLNAHVTPATAWSLACLAKGSRIHVQRDKVFQSACSEPTEHLLSLLMPTHFLSPYERELFFYKAFRHGPSYAVLTYLWNTLIFPREKYAFKDNFLTTLDTWQGVLQPTRLMDTVRFIWDCINTLPPIQYRAIHVKIHNVFVYCIKSQGDAAAMQAICWLRERISLYCPKEIQYCNPSIPALYKIALQFQSNVCVLGLWTMYPQHPYLRPNTSPYEFWDTYITSIRSYGPVRAANSLEILQHLYSAHGAPNVYQFWHYICYDFVQINASTDILLFLKELGNAARLETFNEKDVINKALLHSFQTDVLLARFAAVYFAEKIRQYFDEYTMENFAVVLGAERMPVVRLLLDECNNQRRL